MTQKASKVFINEICSKPPKKNVTTNKTDVFYIDYFWSSGTLDLKDYGPENCRGYGYVLLFVDNFSKFGWTAPLKNKSAQTIKDSFEKILIKSKKKPNLFESDREKDFYNKIFQDFLNNSNIIHYTRNSYPRAVFAENFIRAFRDLHKQPIFERRDANWVDTLSTITKQYINRVLTSTKLTPIQASLRKNEGYVYKNLLDKTKKIKPNVQINDLIRVADLKKTLSKGDTTDWSNKLYKITEINNDSIPSYKVDNLKERCNETLLKKTELSMKESKDVIKALNLN